MVNKTCLISFPYKVITLANKEKTLEQQLLDLNLKTLLYPLLVSVYPGIRKILHKVVLKFRKSSVITFF